MHTETEDLQKYSQVKKHEACEDFKIALSKGEKSAEALIEKYCK